MKLKVVYMVILAAVVGLLATSCSKKQSDGKPDNVDYYTCTMHPSVRSQNPHDKCPICGMDLVPVYKNSTTNNTPPAQGENTNHSETQNGGQKIKFYQSTMSPQETSRVPAKDSMGMEMKP